MKHVAFALLIAGSITGTVRAGETVGQIKQAIGEQCAIVTQYIEAKDTEGGGCGGSDPAGQRHGDIQVSGIFTLESKKYYDIKSTLTNSDDVVVDEIYDVKDAVTNADGIYQLDAFKWELPGSGRFQANLEIRNADTGVVVCSDQSYITAAK